MRKPPINAHICKPNIRISPHLPVLALGLFIAQSAGPARAQDPGAGGQAGPTMAQFNKLQTEVREQRQLILQMMQAEQQRYDMVLKLLRGQGGAGTGAGVLPEPSRLPPVPGVGKQDSGDIDIEATSPSTDEPRAGGKPPKGGKGAKNGRDDKNGTISGRVGVPSGVEASDVYVFIENVKGAAVRKTVEIRQENKQFSPRLAVVQAGTSVVFPNLDSVFHNVFSTSPRNSFDLGTSRAGDTARAVTLTKTGVVEIYCNMHQKMSANVLVVPNSHYARARPDGTFRIDNVPVGARKLVAWGPGAQSTEQRVELTAAGAQVTFALQADERKAHLNKLGQAYGSYRD